MKPKTKPITQHTPAQWEISDKSSRDYEGSEISGGGRIIAVTCIETATQETPEDVVNARLIAAAPELLQACKDAVELIQTARGYFPKSIKNPDTFHLLNIEANSIRSAIAKAEGR